MKFSPCLDIFFVDKPFSRRIETLSSLGYRYFEFWSWWDKNIDEIAETSSEFDMLPVAYCTKFVSLVDKRHKNQYLDGLGQTIECVKKTGTRIIITQVGDELKGMTREKQLEQLVDGLTASAAMLAGTDIILAIEPLNTYYDHQGYFLYSSAETVDVLETVGSPNIKMLFDIYHQQIMEGNLLNTISRYIDYIAHFHIADVPGRHEIGTGEINFTNVLKRIEDSEYSGCVGIELFPLNPNHQDVLKNTLFHPC